ncbi:ubiquitin-specific protease ubp2 [Coemansia sp. RSA 2131]|nr:ubiquitin-specific protease ubp2 [Coemansia sp. RSA 2131]
MGVVDLHGPGVLGEYFIKRQLAEWIPDDIRRQLTTHVHTWVQPAANLACLGTSTERISWHGTCRECLCQLTATIDTEGAGQNKCIDETGHHLHSALSTQAETSNDQQAGFSATCRGRTRCCKCALTTSFSLQLPVIEPSMSTALSTARMSMHSHHPTQGTRELFGTVSTLFRLIKNACAGNTKPIRLHGDAPRRLLKFDAACNHILEIMGFELIGEEFHPPEIVRVAGEALDKTNSHRDVRLTQVRASLLFRRLESARLELYVWAGQIQRQLPRDERQALFAPTMIEDALSRALGTRDYKRTPSGKLTLLMATTGAVDAKLTAAEDAYRALGVLDDVSDALVKWAYTRLTEEDQSDDPVFGPHARLRFDSLVTISAARASKELGVLVANERERGMVATGAIRSACVALFGQPQSEVDTIDSDTVREVFLARVAETTAPKVRMELAEHLAVLADAKQDVALKAYADNVLSSLETSAEIELGGAAGVAAWKGKVDTWEQLPVGLKNIGNTCYLNSILQCLFSILPIRAAVLSHGDNKTWNEELCLGRNDGGRLLTRDEIAEALKFVKRLKHLFEALVTQRVEGWAAKRVRTSSGGHPLASAVAPLAVAPDRELADMLLLRVGSSTTSTTQASSQQQDVDECIAQCVGLLVRALPPPSLMDASDQDSDLSGPGDTWIYKLLSGALEVATERVGASSKKTEKPLNEAFLNLNLNIPGEAADINDCIDAFFAPSEISGSDKHDTDAMETDTSQPGASAVLQASSSDAGQMVRRSRLKNAPPVLCMQVQRVQFDMTTMRAFKINSHLRLREQVSLTPYLHFDGAAAAHSRRHELHQRLRTVNQHLKALNVPIQTAAQTDNAQVSVVSALERVQAFMAGIGRWAELDDARLLLADLPQSASFITSSAENIALQLREMSSALSQARQLWEDELRSTQSELESIYASVPQDDTAYTLHAVFIHSGHSPEFGHYWVYVRDYVREKNLVRWLKFNDSQVTVVDSSEIFGVVPKQGEEAANPYYLVYVRTNCIDETADFGV